MEEEKKDEEITTGTPVPEPIAQEPAPVDEDVVSPEEVSE